MKRTTKITDQSREEMWGDVVIDLWQGVGDDGKLFPTVIEVEFSTQRLEQAQEILSDLTTALVVAAAWNQDVGKSAVEILKAMDTPATTAQPK